MIVIMNNRDLFIKTSDTETASHLRSAGFRELEKEGKYFVFANVNTLTFSDKIDQSKISYSNKLCI